MGERTITATEPEFEFRQARSQSLLRETAGRFVKNRGAVIGLILLVFLIVVALAAPLIAPFDPIKQFVGDRLASPRPGLLFGTDQYGRDVFSRTVWGGRNTLKVPLIAIAIALLGGIALGLAAGYYGGRTDAVISWAMDIMLSFPGLLLTLLMVALLGQGLDRVMIAVGISLIPIFVRMVRGSVFSIKENAYVEAARVVGGGDIRIAARHIFPNVVPSLLVLATTAIAWAIVTGAAMNFVGMGVQPPTPEWGADMASGRDYLRESWWMMTFPGLGVAFTVIAVNLIGDGLSEALDPRLRGR